MPTFNQLVEKDVRHLLRSLQHLHFREVTTLYRRSQPILLPRRREVYVLLLRQLLLRNLTQLLERSPEYVFPTESRLQAISRVRDITYRSTALF